MSNTKRYASYESFEKLFTRLKKDYFDSKLANVEFWSDEEQIQAYCRTILKYFGHDNKRVVVRFANEGANVKSVVDGNTFSITLPNLVFTNNEMDTFKQVYIRGVLLRHELAHAIFTSHRESDKYTKNDKNKHKFFNSLEDARIENLYSDVMKGSRNDFTAVNRALFDTPQFKKAMSEKLPTARAIGQYFMCRCYGIDFPVTEYTEIYESLYQEFKEAIKISDPAKTYEMFNQLSDKALDVQEEYRKIDQESNERLRKLQEDLQEPEDDEPEEEPEDDEESPSPVDEGEQSDECEEGNVEEYIDDLGDEPEEEIETEEIEENVSEDSEEPSEETQIDESQENDIDDSAEEEAIGNEPKQKSEEEEPEEEEEELEEEEFDYDRIDNYSDLFNEMLQQISFVSIATDLEDQKINNMSYQEAMIIPLSKVMEISSVEKFANSIDGYMHYNKIVIANKTVITEIVKFLSMKLQNKSRTRVISHQEEGELDQDNLKEIFVNRENPRVFVKTLKKIVPNSRIIIMIDISGSMGDEKVKLCITNAVILMEVCKKINVKFEVSMFTNLQNNKIRVKSNVSELKKIFGKYSNYVKVYAQDVHGEKLTKTNPMTKINYVSFNHPSDAAVFVIKDINEQNSRNIEKIIGNVYDKIGLIRNMKMVGGSTPEFSSTVAVYKKHREEKNNAFFIFNDGCFDREYSMRTGINSTLMPYVDYNSVRFVSNKNVYEFSKMSVITKINSMIDYLEKAKTDNGTATIMKREMNDSQRAIYDNDLKVMEMFERYANRNIIAYKKMIEIIPADYVEKLEENKFEFDGLVLTQEKKYSAYECEIRAISDDYMYEKFNDVIRKRLHDSLDDLYTIVYRKFINNMRKEGWKVMGIGINSEHGKKYIGEKYFDVVINAEDIKKNFANKLRNIF